jgi:hypothetical protein
MASGTPVPARSRTPRIDTSFRWARTTFLHVGTPAFGTEASLSRFLTGFTMNDPISNTPHTFGDLERRQQDLARLLCACTGRRLPDMIDVLTFKPINMPH